MEKAGKPLFAEDTTPKWFITLGEASIGPMTSAEVYERITRGEITWAHHVWKEGQEGWQRICDLPAFQVVVPQAPDTLPQVRPPGAPKPPVEVKEWFMFHNDTQHGPFSENDVKSLLKSRRAAPDSYVWKDGMGDWEPVTAHELFKSSVPLDVPIAPGSTISEKREFLRRPLIAKVMIADPTRVFVGMCRDISIGGMQVLTEFIPERTGVKLRLNVSPPNLINPTFAPFIAEGVVVRVLDNGRGFSFRFENLNDQSRTTVEKIVSQS